MTIVAAPGDAGDDRRDAALNLLRVTRGTLIRRCMAAAIRIVLESGEVTADDVRALIPIPDDICPKVMGVPFRDLADDGILRRTGFRKSRRPVAHARPLSVWVIADAEAAAARLALLTRSEN